MREQGLAQAPAGKVTLYIEPDGSVTITAFSADLAPIAHALAPNDPRVQTAMEAFTAESAESAERVSPCSLRSPRSLR